MGVEQAVRITERIIATARLLDRAGDMVLSEFRISMGEFELMVYIKAGDDTTGALAGRTGSTPSNVTHMTKALEELGFMTRSVDGRDKRIWRFHITQDGDALLATVQAFYEEAVGLLLSQFTDRQRSEVSEFLKAIQEHLEMVLDNEAKMMDMIRMIKGRTRGAGL
jgi:DNA-binding MarR family transcriptional regulator